MAMSSTQTYGRIAPATRGLAPLRTPSIKALPARRSVAMRFKERSELEEELLQKGPPSASQPQAPPPKGDAGASVSNYITTASMPPRFDPAEPKFPWWIPAFTRRREIFAGRLAMVGFTAACFWEYAIPGHPNIMQQLTIPFQLAGVPFTVATAASLLSGFISYSALAALGPWSPSFDPRNLQDIMRRPAGPPQDDVSPVDYKRWLGITGLGHFTKANELFNGRMAMLGFLFAIWNQMGIGGLAGPGPVAQVGLFLGQLPTQAFYDGIPMTFALWSLLWGGLALAQGKLGNPEGDLDIY
ncbi:hypothetical protein V8C86DRAFT_3133504 [Haematococcus lacustris]